MSTRIPRFLMAALLLSSAAGGVFAQPGGGTIYYVGPWETATSGGTAVMTTINSDGSGRTQLGLGMFGPPSTALHNNHRWFIYTKPIPDSFYPDGTQRSEVFAFRGDYDYALNNTPETRVQLTNDITLQPAVSSPDWVPGDQFISFKARRWSSAEPGAVVVEGGLYTAALAFGLDGNIIGLVALPAAPAIPFPLGVDQWPAFGHYCWSPAADRVAYTNNGLWVATLLNVHTQIAGSAGEPAWSPDGSKIAFNNGIGSIVTIKPNGSGRKTVVARTSTMIFYNPYWSASGSHLVFTGQDASASGGAPNMDVYRATATGGNRTNLTNTPAPFNEYVSNFAGGGWR